MNIEAIVFYVFSALLVGCALMVVMSKNPVRGVLFLILGFIATAILWMLLQAEFLSLALIFVYVGAVMTLFLFVVMMLSIQKVSQGGFVRYAWFAAIIVLVLLGIMFYVLHTPYFDMGSYAQLAQKPTDYSNVKALGMMLYTDYAYAFEVGGVILLVAILSAIGLAFRGRKKGTKAQIIEQQLNVSKIDRLKMIKNGFKKYDD